MNKLARQIVASAFEDELEKLAAFEKTKEVLRGWFGGEAPEAETVKPPAGTTEDFAKKQKDTLKKLLQETGDDVSKYVAKSPGKALLIGGGALGGTALATALGTKLLFD